MRKQLLTLGALGMVLVAATPGPTPVVTIEGVAEAIHPTPELRTALRPEVEALNATLEKIVAIGTDAPDAGQEHRVRAHEAMNGIHEIMKRLSPEQRKAFHEYLHAQLKAAGIEITHPGQGNGVHPSDGSSSHGDRQHTHGNPMAA